MAQSGLMLIDCFVVWVVGWLARCLDGGEGVGVDVSHSVCQSRKYKYSLQMDSISSFGERLISGEWIDSDWAKCRGVSLF